MHENRAESAKWRARCCLHVSLGVLRSFDGTHGEVGTQALTREGLHPTGKGVPGGRFADRNPYCSTNMRKALAQTVAR